jgi:hypothetical protein
VDSQNVSQRGEYKGILNLIRILPHGRVRKDEVDNVIDLCGTVFNIRTAIHDAKEDSGIEGEANEERVARPLKYLESYAALICFNAYLGELKKARESYIAGSPGIDVPPPTPKIALGQSVLATVAAAVAAVATPLPLSASTLATAAASSIIVPSSSPPLESRRSGDGSSSTTTPGFSFPTFSQWMLGRKELLKAMQHLRESPEESLKVDTFIVGEYTEVFEQRNGNVLLKGSILKSDYFAGCRNKNIEQLLDGAINFRPVLRFPVAGTGIPTGEGICNILAYFSQRPYLDEKGDATLPLTLSKTYKAQSITWLNLREVISSNIIPLILSNPKG